MRKPDRVVPDQSLPGYPVYGDHFVPGRCKTRFNLASLLNASAISARRESNGAADIHEQLTWVLAIVEWPVFEAALAEYADEPTIGLIRQLLDRITRTRCLGCSGRVDPRSHQHA